jgi:dipeptidyl aminopeptidase/acylaminoacyl peptidase
LMPEIFPYGTWKSPITAELIVSETIGLGQIAVDGADIYWVEMRPTEGGRNVIVRSGADGEIADVTPAEFNVRSRAHEYGGGAFFVDRGRIFFVNFADQQFYCQASALAQPTPLTTTAGLRFADGLIARNASDLLESRLICIQEDHRQGEHEPKNSLVSLRLDIPTEPQILATGNDFYASPCLSPDGTKLAWLTWNHPNMPWDGTELWGATVLPDGSLQDSQRLAGGPTESIFQPHWSPDGRLYFVSDRTGWWNLYRLEDWQTLETLALAPKQAEFGLPQWVFGMSTYAFASAEQLVCTYNQQGFWYLASLNLNSGQWTDISTPYSEISGLQTTPDGVVFLGSSATAPTAIAKLNLATHETQILRESSSIKMDAGYYSQPQAIAFPTEQGRQAYAFFYPPQNQDYTAPASERPPLIVKSHGGPTAASTAAFNLSIQYWTSRGFALLDVNYGGSTGYGREYRQRLQGQWGIVDVADCSLGAEYLASQGLVDGDRLAIRGGSAGGFTTLAALTFGNTFKAGCSLYGVSDLEALATETHKFEARYLDGLIGAYPEQKELYRQRSPIHFTERLNCPVIFFQGLEDKVVPPNQAERMVEAIAAKGLPVAYVGFAGEQHGFRRAETIKRTLEGELYFYGRIFGFQPADPIEPVAIQNLPS